MHKGQVARPKKQFLLSSLLNVFHEWQTLDSLIPRSALFGANMQALELPTMHLKQRLEK